MQQECALGFDHSLLLLINNSMNGDEMNSRNNTHLAPIMTDSGNRTTSKMEEKHAEASGSRGFFSDIGIAIDSKTRQAIKCFRKTHYRDIYPDMDLDNDVLDESALTLYTRNEKGNVNSTARLTVDGGSVDLPQEQFLGEYRKAGLNLMELGRFIIQDGNLELLKSYYRAFHRVASNLQCDAIVMSMKHKDVRLHQRLIGLRVIAENTETYGGPYSLDVVIWDIKATDPKFFEWIGGGHESN